MPSLWATSRASVIESREQHGRSGTWSPLQNSFIVAPTTSYPASTSSAAATDESTPPDIATSTRSLIAPLPPNAERGTRNAGQTALALGFFFASLPDGTFPFCSAFRLPRSALTSPVQYSREGAYLLDDPREHRDHRVHVFHGAVPPEREPQRCHAELARHAHRCEHVRGLDRAGEPPEPGRQAMPARPKGRR